MQMYMYVYVCKHMHVYIPARPTTTSMRSWWVLGPGLGLGASPRVGPVSGQPAHEGMGGGLPVYVRMQARTLMHMRST